MTNGNAETRAISGKEFNNIRAKDGLKATLIGNAARFTEEGAWFKASWERD